MGRDQRSKSAERSGAHRPGVALKDLPAIDLILVSHNHYDHMDMPALARLWQRDKPRFITPLGNDTLLRKGIGDIAVQAVGVGGENSAHRSHCSGGLDVAGLR